MLLCRPCEAEESKAAPTPQPRIRVQRGGETVEYETREGKKIAGPIRSPESWYFDTLTATINQRFNQLRGRISDEMEDKTGVVLTVEIDPQQKSAKILEFQGGMSIKNKAMLIRSVEQSVSLVEIPKEVLARANPSIKTKMTFEFKSSKIPAER